MSTTRSFAEHGGLMAYEEYTRDTEQRVAVFVDKILKGAKSADLPVEQPTKFELVINLKTAKALRVDHSPDTLAPAGPGHRVAVSDQRGRLLRSTAVC
jgi:putative ABC transport system substrate-binding protein